MLELPTPNRLLMALNAINTGVGNSGCLNGVVEHPHEIGIRQIINHHHQGAEHSRDGQLSHRLGDRDTLKEGALLIVVHCNTLFIAHSLKGAFLVYHILFRGDTPFPTPESCLKK